MGALWGPGAQLLHQCFTSVLFSVGHGEFLTIALLRGEGLRCRAEGQQELAVLQLEKQAGLAAKLLSCLNGRFQTFCAELINLAPT